MRIRNQLGRLIGFTCLLGFSTGCALNSSAVSRHALPQPGPFHPAWWCHGPNAQTIWGSILRPTLCVSLRRERWEMPDGDFIDVDLMVGEPGAPVMIALHGLEGSSRSKQILGLMRAAHRRGWQGVAVNFRSCSGEPNRLRRSYHGGETSDLSWVIQKVIAQRPGSPILCVGVSLGGNVLLKYLGEQGEGLPAQVRAAAAISAPFDLAASARGLERGFSRIYMHRLVQSLRRKTLEKLKRYPDIVDRDALKAVRTLEQFDNVVTAPVHGFRDAAEYWAASSSAGFLPKIRRPTLLINAQDDPVAPSSVLPVDAVAKNAVLRSMFPASGGHVGFIGGPWPWQPERWAERQALAFLAGWMPWRDAPS